MNDSEFRDPMTSGSGYGSIFLRGLKLRFYYWLAIAVMVCSTYVVIGGVYSLVAAWYEQSFSDSTPDYSNTFELLQDIKDQPNEEQKNLVDQLIKQEITMEEFEDRLISNEGLTIPSNKEPFWTVFFRHFLNPWFFGVMAAMLTAVIIATSYARYLEFRDHPAKMAEWLGATEVHLESDREDHWRLRQIVAETAQSLSIRCPSIYIILNDGGRWKLFITGTSVDKSSVIVSKTLVDCLFVKSSLSYGENSVEAQIREMLEGLDDVQAKNLLCQKYEECRNDPNAELMQLKIELMLKERFGYLKRERVERLLRDHVERIKDAPRRQNLRMLAMGAGAEIMYELADDVWQITADNSDKRIGFDVWRLMQVMRGLASLSTLPLLIAVIFIVMFLMIVGAAGFRFSRKVIDTVSNLTKKPADEHKLGISSD